MEITYWARVKCCGPDCQKKAEFVDKPDTEWEGAERFRERARVHFQAQGWYVEGSTTLCPDHN